MPSLTIRNLDDGLVERLKRRAQNHNRSLESELRQILADAAEGTAPASLRGLAERIAALTPGRQTDSTPLLREDRER